MDKTELAKYREHYSRCLIAIVEMHNTHVTFIANPTLRSAASARKEIGNVIELLTEFRRTNKHVLAEHSRVTKQEHVQQKELARTNKLTKKGK